jgi:Electron transfer DM13
MWLSVGWMVLVGVICLAVAVRKRRLALPVIATYLVAGAAIGVYLGSSLLFDRVAHEHVATAAAALRPGKAHRPARPRNALLARGLFQSGEHSSRGVASAIGLASGGRVLTLTRFSTSNGPDLRVYLVAGPASRESEVRDFVDLGGLKGNKGNQQYELPRSVNVHRYATVVVWCRAFSVLFARAPLERS